MARLGPHGLPLRSANVSVTLTGAESQALAGNASSAVPSPTQLGPHALATRRRLGFERDLSAAPVGAQSNAEAGVVQVTATGEQQTTQLGPLGLANKAREFSPKQAPNQDIDAFPVGAEIEGQAAFPDSANATIYVDASESLGESGSVASQDAFVTGSQALSEAGSVTINVDASPSIGGIESPLEAGEVNAGSGVFASLVGAESLGEAQAPTLETDVNVIPSGAPINAQASELGTDTDSPVSATVTGAAIALGAGTVTGGPDVTVNLVGVTLSAGAGAIEFQFIPPDEIVNTNATTNVPNNYEQDPKSGFRQYPGDLITDGQTGDYTRRRSYDSRHPQEAVKSVRDRQRGPQLPEGEDNFIDTPITPDDL